MGLNVQPEFRLIANSADITETIRKRFKSLRFTDEAGTESDTLEVTLADHVDDAPIAIPPRGAELELFLGYDGATRRMGMFICDEVEIAGFPSELIIRARAAPYKQSKQGKIDLQSQKTRSWKEGTTIGGMVAKIASEHGMKSAVAPALAGVELPHTDQSHESDLNLLVRIAKRYDGLAKPANGYILFTKRGDSAAVSGASLPRITLTPRDGSDYRVTITSRESPGTVVAYYRVTTQAQRREVKIGDGDPVARLRMGYRDQAAALAAAKSEQQRRARAERQLSYSFPGRPEVIAESPLTMQGFRDGVNGDWLITRAEHYLGPDGYRCMIDADLPNSHPDVQAAAGATVDDQVQTGA